MKYLILSILCLAFLSSCKSQKATADEVIYTPTETRSEDRPQRGGDGQRKGPPSIGEIFQMDSNGDGALSKSEVKGPLEQNFDAIDLDGNGLLSRLEVENAPKPERKQGGGQRGGQRGGE